jgi:hypothetical protein
MEKSYNIEEIKAHFGSNWWPFYEHLLEGRIRSKSSTHLSASCPFREHGHKHDDRHPSLSIEISTGLWKCHTAKEGGNPFQFYAKLKGLDPRRDFPRILQGIAEDFGIPVAVEGQGKSKSKSKLKGKEKGKRRIVATYDYTDEQGQLLYQVIRYEPKSFSQRRPDGKGGWIYNLEGVRRVLYRLPEFLSGPDPVIVVEGEKDVESLRRLGLNATTNPMGAGKWRDEFSESLRGREVIIIPDNDPEGLQHVCIVARSLLGKAAKVKIAHLPEGVKDASEALERWAHPLDELSSLLSSAEEYHRATWRRVEGAFQSLLELPDLDPVRVVLATVIANRLPGDPVWLFLVAPPASGKTEIIMALSGLPDVYTLSTLTENTFLSGKVVKTKGREEEISLLPRLTGKILVMKDFAPILQMRFETRDAIFSQLRDIYDGSTAKAVGSEKREIRWEGKIGFIAGITQVLDTYTSFLNLLGERFLQFRLTPPDEERALEKAILSVGREKDLREGLKRVVADYLETIEIPPLESFHLPEEIKRKLRALVRLVIRARTGTMRDYYGAREIYYVPDHEGPARLAKQLTMLMYGLALLRGSLEVSVDDYRLAYKCALDTLHKTRRQIIEFMAGQGEMVRTSKLATQLDLSTPTATRYLEDLTAVGILFREKEEMEEAHSPNLWGMEEEVRRWWEEARP